MAATYARLMTPATNSNAIRTRFQRPGAALASTGQPLSKIQKLLEESERKWLGPLIDTAP
jgi:hypothetical protein